MHTSHTHETWSKQSQTQGAVDKYKAETEQMSKHGFETFRNGEAPENAQLGHDTETFSLQYTNRKFCISVTLRKRAAVQMRENCPRPLAALSPSSAVIAPRKDCLLPH